MFTLTVLVGCSSDPVADDIKNYLNNQMEEPFELEVKVVQQLNEVLGTNYTNDEEVLSMIDEVSYDYSSLVAQIEAILPNTRELKEIHELLIDGHTKQLSALLQLQMAYQLEDSELLYKASEKFNDGKSVLREYIIEFSELAKAHNVEIKKIQP